MPNLLRLRALPWLVLFEVARTVQSHLVEHLSPADRHRVAAIVKGSHGDPRRVTPRERDELKAIAAKLHITRLGRDLVPTVGRAAAGRGRRR